MTYADGAVKREYWWVRSLTILKSGKRSVKLIEEYAIYSPVQACQLCGRFGGLRSVRGRNDCYGWNRLDWRDWATDSHHVLCLGCRNRVYPIVALGNASREFQKLSNKLIREAQRVTKDRRDAGEFDGLHRTSETEANGPAAGHGDCEAREPDQHVDAG